MSRLKYTKIKKPLKILKWDILKQSIGYNPEINPENLQSNNSPEYSLAVPQGPYLQQHVTFHDCQGEGGVFLTTVQGCSTGSMSSKGRCYRLTFSLALGFGGKRVLGSESQLRESVFLTSPLSHSWTSSLCWGDGGIRGIALSSGIGGFWFDWKKDGTGMGCY